MEKSHENYKELIWMLVKTDFKLRYQGSFLGYIWAILSPLLTFAVLNFVFSSVFARGNGAEYYPLQLLIGIMTFTFFSDGTRAGLGSLVAKSRLVTKIYVPRWVLIFASTMNTGMLFLMNLIVLVIFFIFYRFLPSLEAILFFVLLVVLMYVVILGFSFLTAAFYVRFRDLSMIWAVIVRALFYATPIIYPIQVMPEYIQKVILLSPIGFIVHFSKESLINNHFPEIWQFMLFVVASFAFLFIGIFIHKKTIKKIAENI
ncbi:ABC transporter permease [bacterium]|jgi:ABC-type polysaccharide/polyol phosphate export permease|nr:ABC transporter permease [bacterium]MBT4251259.1 ABC transporter permease [bacterium]MBT4598360.1 ABC transporter permease [bacterium]MBT6754193.1 ABC transporter permease [bacterium]MBT7038036.1 ABC transporter permease [bacterium]